MSLIQLSTILGVYIITIACGVHVSYLRLCLWSTYLISTVILRVMQESSLTLRALFYEDLLWLEVIFELSESTHDFNWISFARRFLNLRVLFQVSKSAILGLFALRQLA
jgi:hypothetical protein